MSLHVFDCFSRVSVQVYCNVISYTITNTVLCLVSQCPRLLQRASTQLQSPLPTFALQAIGIILITLCSCCKGSFQIGYNVGMSPICRRTPFARWENHAARCSSRSFKLKITFVSDIWRKNETQAFQYVSFGLNNTVDYCERTITLGTLQRKKVQDW